MNAPKQVNVYRNQEGKIPLYEWIESINNFDTRAKIFQRINRLRIGNIGDSRSVGGGIHELRIHYGPGFRVYFGNDGNRIIILLCGGDKGGQKRDIKKAQEYWEDYKKQSHEHPSFS